MPHTNQHQNGLPSGLAQAWEKLAAILGAASGGPGMAVAFSGGLDSRFLIHACLLLDIEVLALHFTGPHIQTAQTSRALLWLEERRVPCVTVRVEVLEIPQVRFTAPDRCYHCKLAGFNALNERTAKFAGFSLEAFGGAAPSQGAPQVYDGTLFSDFSEYRPGRKALQELNVRSPLAEAGLTKEQIRQLARALGLDNPEQPAQTCLLTRFDYGLEVSLPALKMLERAEAAVAAVLSDRAKAAKPGGAGARLPEFRVRLLNENGTALPELHLRMPEEELCSAPGLTASLETALAGCGMAAGAIRAMPGLSGFFDRRGKLGQSL